MSDLNKDIEILKEKLKILNNTKLKKTDQLERELQAIENVIKERGKKDIEIEVLKRQVEIDNIILEKQDKELETWQKIAEKLAEEISYTDNHICKYFDTLDKCKYEAGKDNKNICTQCIIDWAIKEVEK